jgi:predicted metalloprotease
VVLAHEFGHAIQQRNSEFDQPTILKEQQADCFAGAWAAHIARGEAAGLTFGDEETKNSLIAMIQVRDPPDGDVFSEDAHGTGFDRVGAFQDGFLDGTERCKPFFTEDRQKNLIDIQAVAGQSGNLPFVDPTGKNSDIVTLMPADLDRFWVGKINGVEGVSFTAPTLTVYPDSGPFPDCAGASENDFKSSIFYCPSANQIMVDQDFAEQLDADALFGDMSVGYLMGQAYSEAIQQTLNSTLADEKRELLNDCFTGAWVADDIPSDSADPNSPARGGGQLTLSAGDLDEAIVTALKISDDTSDENNHGTAFEKIDSFRAGVLGGIDACKQRLN